MRKIFREINISCPMIRTRTYAHQGGEGGGEYLKLSLIFSKQQTEKATRKKELWKIAIAHSLMQQCKKEECASPLQLYIERCVLKVIRSWVLIDTQHSIKFFGVILRSAYI